jgi:hypothetical protein
MQNYFNVRVAFLAALTFYPVFKGLQTGLALFLFKPDPFSLIAQ